MSLCCFPLFRGSRLKKAQSGFSFLRCWRKSLHRRHLPPAGKIHPQDIGELADGFTYAINGHGRPLQQARNTVQCRAENSSDDVMEVLVHEAHYNIYRVKVQVHQTDTTVHQKSQIVNRDILEQLVNGFQYSTVLDKGKVLQSTESRTTCTEGGAELSFKLREASQMRTLQEDAVKKFAELLAPAVPDGNMFHLSTFGTMQSFFS